MNPLVVGCLAACAVWALLTGQEAQLHPEEGYGSLLAGGSLIKFLVAAAPIVVSLLSKAGEGGLIQVIKDLLVAPQPGPAPPPLPVPVPVPPRPDELSPREFVRRLLVQAIERLLGDPTEVKLRDKVLDLHDDCLRKEEG